MNSKGNKERDIREKGYPNKNYRIREQNEKEYEDMIRELERKEKKASYRVDPLDKRYTLSDAT